MKIAQTLILAVVVAFGLACGYSKSSTPPAPGTMPNIQQLNPSSQAAGTSFTLEVDGTNFASNAVVNFGSTKMTPATATAMKLTVAIPGTAIMNAGSVAVTVTNPGTAGGPYGGGTQAETSQPPVTFTVN